MFILQKVYRYQLSDGVLEEMTTLSTASIVGAGVSSCAPLEVPK